MNRKTSIIALFLFFGVSFSVSARESVYLITSINSGSTVSCGAPYSTGNYVIYSKLKNFCIGGTFTYNGTTHTITSSGIGSGIYWKVWAGNGISHTVGGIKRQSHSCTDNQQVNPNTGQCENAPPTCENGQEFNPDSGLCEDPTPYCEQSSTLDSIFAAEQSCAAEGGVFSYQCHNGNDFTDPSLETTCNEPPDACVMGFPNWPECLDDYNPTNPIDPPDGGFVNPDGSTGNSPDPSFNKPEPDPVTPNETTDTALLEAFQNMNRDNNQALGHISEDINKGNADIKNKLDDVKNSTNAVGQSIVDQMNQDYQIAQQNRQAISDQNMIIGKAAQGVSDSVIEGSGDVVDEVRLQGTRLNDSLNKIADKLCDPREPDANCEDLHGLGNATVSDIIHDVADSTDTITDRAYTGVVSAAQGFVNDSGTADIEAVITSDIDSFMDVFPSSGSCSPFSLPTAQGIVTFDCTFSDKAKTLISFILYVYTAWTLISILLSGITPVPNQQPNKG